jgi:phenylalanyl-tRNA synthetase beta chain
MTISYNWLKDYACFKQTPDELAVLLTDCGLEVESIEKFETIKGSLKGVVTGRVVSCEKHPDADRLSLTTVDIGGNELLSIVCGAPNVREGQMVMVATAGTVLYTSKGDLEIKKAKIRGQLSEGMICAEDELGVGTSHEGIMVLPDDIPKGVQASDYFKLYEDWVYEIGLTPNRIDAASHIGVARDIVAVVNHLNPEERIRLIMPDTSGFVVDNNDLNIPVTIENADACRRYSGVTISNLQVGESPEWLKTKLKAIGLKPINNVVDATNFVLHELGQPLHAFDLSQIDGMEIRIRKPSKGTLFLSLDEEELELTGQDLMICSASSPMCMAGILGGINSGVTVDTKAIFLESAWFDPKTIRMSSNHHSIKTDASFRFERGANPEMTLVALKRAAMMIKEVAGGIISSEITDVYPAQMNAVELKFYYQTLDRLAGKVIPREEVKSILTDLDFVIQYETGEFLALTIPCYRVDVTREADVVEEIMRIYGYNNIELPDRLHSSIALSPKPDKEKLQNVVSDLLTSKAFYEIMNNSLSKGFYYDGNGFEKSSSVSLLNPLSQDLNVLRQSLLFGGLETIAYNQNRKIQDMKLFEFGNVYWYQPQDKKYNSTALDNYNERTVLSLFVTGNRHPETWSEKQSVVSFFDIRSVVNNIIERLGIQTRTFDIALEESNTVFDYKQVMSLEGKPIISLGLLSKLIIKQFDIKQDVYFAEIEWEHLIHYSGKSSLLYEEIARFPEVRRDLALLINEEVSFETIETLAFTTEKKLLKKVGLFDIFKDDRLGKGKKSYAVSFILQDRDKTLTDKEIDAIMEKLSRTFTSQLQASIR